MTVRLSRTREVVGRSAPNTLNIARSPSATRNPAASPTTAPIRPITPASRITDPRICLRDAPSVRSTPNSETRWATVIEKVLKMMNAPTSTAT